MTNPSNRRRSFNNKRRMQQEGDPEKLTHLAEHVKYEGNPAHKRKPGDFGSVPPAQPAPNKTLCDDAGIFTKVEALKLLREGARRGLISEQTRGEFPQNIWAVTEDGHPLEAQLENQTQGIYHGYPVPEADPFRSTILDRWGE